MHGFVSPSGRTSHFVLSPDDVFLSEVQVDGQSLMYLMSKNKKMIATFIAHRVQQSHCSTISLRVLLLTYALALSASKFVRKKKAPRIYTSMHSGGFELTKRTYTRLEDNLIRHRGDRPRISGRPAIPPFQEGGVIRLSLGKL